jgi:hypothetical protein
MASFKNTLFFLIITLILISLSSCVRDILGFDCGKHITLGKLIFADSTKTLYSNWTGKEMLIFKDSLGNEETFSSKEGKIITLTKPLVIKTLCDSGWLDKQTERYDSEAHFVDFAHPNHAFFRLALYSDTIQQKEGLIIYDRFAVEFNGASFYIPLKHGNEKPIPTNWNSWVTQYAPKFVADTMIMGKNFKNVFYADNGYNKSAIYFQKTKMIIGFREGGKTWLLDKIK